MSPQKKALTLTFRQLKANPDFRNFFFTGKSGASQPAYIIRHPLGSHANEIPGRDVWDERG